MLKALDQHARDAGQPSDWQVAKSFARLTGGFWRRCRQGLALVGHPGERDHPRRLRQCHRANCWNGWFFDALEKKDGESALIAMAVFPVLVLIAAGLGVVILVSRETFQVHWRAWVTARLADGWIGERRFYRLGLSGYEPANPEYRIADDVRWATEPVVDFAIGLLSAVITAITFIGILWSIGGSLTVAAGGTSFRISRLYGARGDRLCRAGLPA